MIVTLTGAYRNCGDHLIGHRARALLAKYVDKEIINIDRKKIEPKHYGIFNEARFVFLCGGPAYQKNMYPGIYPLELDKITSKVIPFGLGYKAALDSRGFTFTGDSLYFIKRIHKGIQTSSARDVETVEILKKNNVNNVTMTGCPAWFDLDKEDSAFVRMTGMKSLVVSAPARITDEFLGLLKFLASEFPNVKRSVALHHGYLPGFHPYHMLFFAQHVKLSRTAKSLGFKVLNLSGNLDSMLRIYKEAEMHLGYRVHAHILRMSQRLPSLLISEDRRGVSQSKSLRCPIISGDSNNLSSSVADELDRIVSDPEYYDQTCLELNKRARIMKNFLQNLQAEGQ